MPSRKNRKQQKEEERRRNTSWLKLALMLKPYTVVFLASGCTLVIEIVAGRILAPTIGVSLYTWTSIIGIVLAGISVGNYLGGRLADRFPRPTTLGIILLGSGASSLLVLAIVNPVAGVFGGMPIVWRIIVMTAILFLPPGVILGMVTPIVIKLELRNLEQTGSVVGRLYAVSTAGSILGTFLTGFVLIELMGTRQVIFAVAIVLVVLAVAVGELWKLRQESLAMGAGVIALLSYNFATSATDSPCLRESGYYCIYVYEETAEDGEVIQILRLDQLVHSYVSLDDPTYLTYGYQKVFADMATLKAAENPAMRTLFLGGGGYTMPRYLETVFPDSASEVIEIDPAVTEVAYSHLAITPDLGIVTYTGDARTKVKDLAGERYDLIVVDVFNDVGVPYHLTTHEFNEDAALLLGDDGIFATNLLDRLQTGRFLRSYVRTLQETYPYVYVISDYGDWTFDERYGYVVAGSRRPLSRAQLEQANRLAGRETAAHLMPHDIMEGWKLENRSVILTDNYVPVDNMLAPLYRESR
ncbi:MAG: hypothetical protein FJ317_06250 [SAR202 cluster bacterium]|nr:hypothetical protein [SAR202 cluster bacterium]